MINLTKALLYYPFQGDETDVKTMADKIVKASKEHPRCQICEGSIAKGEIHRALTEINREEQKIVTFRFCNACTAAMASPRVWCDGHEISDRYLIGGLARANRKSAQ